MGRAPNILLITTDEERFAIPRPQGFSLPGRERIAERGVTFERFYAASTQCSSARSVMYTGRQVPVTGIYDNDTIPSAVTSHRWPRIAPATSTRCMPTTTWCSPTAKRISLRCATSRATARDGAQRDLVAACSAKLEALITAEIGTDTDTWVLDRPNLVGLPAWHGDRAG
jgi:hypothetical protein